MFSVRYFLFHSLTIFRSIFYMLFRCDLYNTENENFRNWEIMDVQHETGFKLKVIDNFVKWHLKVTVQTQCIMCQWLKIQNFKSCLLCHYHVGHCHLYSWHAKFCNFKTKKFQRFFPFNLGIFATSHLASLTLRYVFWLGQSISIFFQCLSIYVRFIEIVSCLLSEFNKNYLSFLNSQLATDQIQYLFLCLLCLISCWPKIFE